MRVRLLHRYVLSVLLTTAIVSTCRAQHNPISHSSPSITFGTPSQRLLIEDLIRSLQQQPDFHLVETCDDIIVQLTLPISSSRPEILHVIDSLLESHSLIRYDHIAFVVDTVIGVSTPILVPTTITHKQPELWIDGPPPTPFNDSIRALLTTGSTDAVPFFDPPLYLLQFLKHR